MHISRRAAIRAIALTTAFAALIGRVRTASSSEVHKVVIKDFTFKPAELHIKRGDTVEWRNIDGFLHTATSDESGHFDTGIMTTGESASHTFSADEDMGEIPYHCEIYSSVRAKIVVGN